MASLPSSVSSETSAIMYLANVTQGLGPITSVTGATKTLTPAEMRGAIIDANTGSTLALTLPTAAALVAAMENPQVGSRVSFDIVNRNSGVLTITPNTGNTLIGTATMPTATGQFVKGVVTNVTPGAEAVTYYTILKTAS